MKGSSPGAWGPGAEGPGAGGAGDEGPGAGGAGAQGEGADGEGAGGPKTKGIGAGGQGEGDQNFLSSCHLGRQGWLLDGWYLRCRCVSFR